MVLTKKFKELVQARVAHGPAFAETLLREGVEAMLAGDVDTGKTVLRDYINATVGFEKLGEAIATSPKSLMRMFGYQGNPQARNLFGVIAYLQAEAQLRLRVAVDRRAQGAPRARIGCRNPLLDELARDPDEIAKRRAACGSRPEP